MADPLDDGERTGTLWVLEDPIPDERRWYWHWDLDRALPPLPDDLNALVAWGIANTATVVVRTLGMVVYCWGERPTADDENEELREWPPSAAEQVRIESDYDAYLADAAAAVAAEEAFVTARTEWLRARAPDAHEREPTFIVMPDDLERSIELVEFDGAPGLAAARLADVTAFGQVEEVLATTSGRRADDPWITKVCAALTREREQGTSLAYPPILLVMLGEGFMFHVSRVTNRDSIRENGLDWRLMRSTGIAGSTQPEMPGIFVCATEDDADFFVRMAGEAVDVWRVRVDDLWLEGDSGANGSDSWMVALEPIDASRLELLRSDVLRTWGDD